MLCPAFNPTNVFMKKLLLSLAVFTTLFSSCKKDDDDADVPNTFIINDQVHQVRNCGRIGGNFTVFINDGTPANEAHSATFIFAGSPTTGTYKIVEYPVAPNEVSILVQNGSLAELYRSTGSEPRNVRVTVDNNNKAWISVFDGASLQPVVPTGDPAGVELKANFREL